MNRLISRTSNKIGVFYRRTKLRIVERSIIGKLTMVLWLAACLTLIGCDSRKPTPAVTATTEQSPNTSVTRSGPQGASPIPCGSPAGPLGPCSDDLQLMQICGNCDADGGYPSSANQYGWWCTNSFDEAVKILGFTRKCKVTRVSSQAECCNHTW